jgi:hypothetical protein
MRSKEAAVRLADHMNREQLLTFMHLRETSEFIFEERGRLVAHPHAELHGITKALLFTSVEKARKEAFGAEFIFIESSHIAHLDTQGYIKVLSGTQRV